MVGVKRLRNGLEDGEEDPGRAGVEQMSRVVEYGEIMSTAMAKTSVENEELEVDGRLW